MTSRQRPPLPERHPFLCGFASALRSCPPGLRFPLCGHIHSQSQVAGSVRSGVFRGNASSLKLVRETPQLWLQSLNKYIRHWHPGMLCTEGRTGLNSNSGGTSLWGWAGCPAPLLSWHSSRTGNPARCPPCPACRKSQNRKCSRGVMALTSQGTRADASAGPSASPVAWATRLECH